MANTLKIKIGIIVFSLTILIIIHLFKSNFNAPVTMKRWQTLTWEDFQGFAKPFTGWGAAINSNVYLEFDSAQMRYNAYAAMNNQKSWKKGASEAFYLLNHEQYHFNITEYFARKMNAFLKSNNPDEAEAWTQLASLRSELSAFQYRYDNQSDHGVNIDQQRKWQYQIDSLLHQFLPDSGFVTDYYSGAQVFLPTSCEFETSSSRTAYRIYASEPYGMTLSINSFQNKLISTQMMRKVILEFYRNDSLEIQSFDSLTTIYNYEARILAYDSVRQQTYDQLFVSHENYLYLISAKYPDNGNETQGYRDIANSFINSFKIIDPNPYWFAKFNEKGHSIIHSKAILGTLEDDNSICFTTGEQSINGFYRGPFFNENGDLFFAYDIASHEDSLIYKTMATINDDIYSGITDSTDHLFFVPKENLPKSAFQLDVGYLLKEDTVEKCYKFYHQFIDVNSAIKKPSSEESL